MVSPVRAVMVVLLLGAVMLAGPTAPVAATTECANDTATISIGTGALMISVPELDGVNHVDIPYPSCSNGNFAQDSGTSPAIRFQNFCGSGFLRIYAEAGTVNVPAKVIWLEGTGTTCSGDEPEEPPGHQPHSPPDPFALARELIG